MTPNWAYNQIKLRSLLILGFIGIIFQFFKTEQLKLSFQNLNFQITQPQQKHITIYFQSVGLQKLNDYKERT